MPRTTRTRTTTSVREVYSPFGRARENPPCLGHLRDFIAKCEGLPDEVKVRIEQTDLDEGGRRNTILSAVYDHPDPEPEPEPEPSSGALETPVPGDARYYAP